jgi:hypothetical protein
LSLFPRFEESISPEFYRWTGKIRVFAIAFLLVSNVFGGLQLEEMGYDPDFYSRAQASAPRRGRRTRSREAEPAKPVSAVAV